MLVIGFTNHYYTLWQRTKGIQNRGGQIFECTNHNYLQNLSMNFEEAEAKVKAMTENYDIDLDQRGIHQWGYTERMIQNFPVDYFTFGKLQGSSMIGCKDAWQLNRAMQQEAEPRRRVIARTELIKLGELVKRSWMEKVWSGAWGPEEIKTDEDGKQYRKDPEPIMIEKLRTWMPRRKYEYQIKREKIESKSGHFFKDGQRLDLEIKEIGRFSFQGASYGYGQDPTVYIIHYETSTGEVVKYKGNNPPHFENDWSKVKATAKHVEYNGKKETQIQRIKLI